MGLDDLKIARENKKVLSNMLLGDNYRLKISERIIAIAQQIVSDDGYKNAWVGLGRMVALKNAIEDTYMLEKIMYGKAEEEHAISNCVSRCGKFPRVNRLDDVI